MIEIKQKVTKVDENNSSFDNKHQESSQDGSFYCKNTYGRNYVWTLNSYVEDTSVGGRSWSLQQFLSNMRDVETNAFIPLFNVNYRSSLT
jgi:hypothetical protein